MKVKYTLEKTESQGIRQLLEDIPIDLCGYVSCPDGNGNNDGDTCECCPMKIIQENWSRGLTLLCKQTSEALKKIEE